MGGAIGVFLGGASLRAHVYKHAPLSPFLHEPDGKLGALAQKCDFACASSIFKNLLPACNQGACSFQTINHKVFPNNKAQRSFPKKKKQGAHLKKRAAMRLKREGKGEHYGIPVYG